MKNITVVIMLEYYAKNSITDSNLFLGRMGKAKEVFPREDIHIVLSTSHLEII